MLSQLSYQSQSQQPQACFLPYLPRDLILWKAKFSKNLFLKRIYSSLDCLLTLDLSRVCMNLVYKNHFMYLINTFFIEASGVGIISSQKELREKQLVWWMLVAKVMSSQQSTLQSRHQIFRSYCTKPFQQIAVVAAEVRILVVMLFQLTGLASQLFQLEVLVAGKGSEAVFLCIFLVCFFICLVFLLSFSASSDSKNMASGLDSLSELYRIIM